MRIPFAPVPFIAAVVLALLCASPVAAQLFNPFEALRGQGAEIGDESKTWPEFPKAPRGPVGEGVERGWQPGEGELEDAMQQREKTHWQLFNSGAGGTALRAPYPYYESPGSINTDNGALGRPAWFEFDNEYSWNEGKRRGLRTRLRGVQGFGSYGFEFTDLFTAKRFDAVQWFKGWTGFAFPMLGANLLGGIGGSWIDDHASLHNKVSFDLTSGIQMYPIWPLGVDAGFNLSFFETGRTVIDWSMALKVQLFRSAFFTFGWRDITSPGHAKSFRTDALYFGISLSFSNLKWVFTAPQGGPADGLLSALTGERPFGR